MKLIYTLVLIISFFTSAFSQTTKESIEVIRSNFKYVNNDLNAFKTTKEELYGESAEGGEITRYFDKGSIVKVRLQYYGETGKLFREYYIRDQQLLFVFDQDFQYNVPYFFDSLFIAQTGYQEGFDPSKTKLEENRYYFFDDKMIRWISPEGTFLSIDHEGWFDKEKFYLEDLKSRF